jgi:hypothetical protein
MKRRPCIQSLSICLVVAALATARPALATLGETIDSVASDRKALSAVQGEATVRKGYTVHEMMSGATAIREYLSPAGIVFAIAWNGLTNPDLTLFLGSYAGEYHQAIQKTPRERGRRSHRVTTDRIVVEKWGHMRNLQGRAYVPNLIPPGVSVDDIK